MYITHIEIYSHTHAIQIFKKQGCATYCNVQKVVHPEPPHCIPIGMYRACVALAILN